MRCCCCCFDCCRDDRFVLDCVAVAVARHEHRSVVGVGHHLHRMIGVVDSDRRRVIAVAVADLVSTMLLRHRCPRVAR